MKLLLVQLLQLPVSTVLKHLIVCSFLNIRDKASQPYKTTGKIVTLRILICDISHTEINTAEPLVPGPNPSEIEIAFSKLKRYKFPGSDQISAELSQALWEKLRSKIYKKNSMV
jgi:hypothetical protein